MKKTLNVEAMQSELSTSAFFQALSPSSPAPKKKPARPKPSQQKAQAVSPPRPVSTVPVLAATEITERTSLQPDARTPLRPSVRPFGRRIITRYAFEFFQDQLQHLKRFSLDEKYRDEKGSMSQMVREALDAYISRRLNQEAEGAAESTPVRPDGQQEP